jgi:hypothetical protein
MNDKQTRILGLAIRARWLGFAAIDHSGHLFDWGVIYYQRPHTPAIRSALRRTASMVHRIDPDRIAILCHARDQHRALKTVRSVTREILAVAKRMRIPIMRVERTVLRQEFGHRKSSSKMEIACLLAHRFPELAWRLPGERKIWSKEDSRMALFDAVAVTLAVRGDSHPVLPFAVPSGRPLGDV